MAHSKKQKEHLIQNAFHKVRKEIQDMERDEKCPQKQVERALWNEYWEKKYKQED